MSQDSVMKGSLPPENDEDGNIEYKKMFEANPEGVRTNKLVTQAIWRMNEGYRLYGVKEAIYYIGINNNGSYGGLTLAELLDSIKLFTNIVARADAKIVTTKFFCVGNSNYAKVYIQSIPKKKICDELMIGLLGPPRSGKTSLVGFISYGINDDGYGNAREVVFRHDHESNQGNTSSIKYDLIGYSNGKLNNYTTGFIGSWEDIVEESDRLINISDMPGNYKYFRTSMFSIASHSYDYIILTINADFTADDINILLFHTFVCYQMNVHVVFIITKIDIADKKNIDDIVMIIKEFCSIHFSDRFNDVKLINASDEQIIASMMLNKVIPIVPLSIVTKENIDILNMLLCKLPVPERLNQDRPEDSCMFMVYDKVFLSDIGTAVIGRMIDGSVHTNNTYLIGPINNSFSEVKIKSIHKKQIATDHLIIHERGSLQIKINDKQIQCGINKYMMLITPNNMNRFINTFYVILNKKCAIVTKDGFEFSESAYNDIKIDAKVMIFSNNVYEYINILELKDGILKVKFDENYINYIEDGAVVVINYNPRFLFGTAVKSISTV
jgi:GTPase